MSCHLAVIYHHGTIRRLRNRCQLSNSWIWPSRRNSQFAPVDECAPTNMCWHAGVFPHVVRQIDLMLYRPATITTTDFNGCACSRVRGVAYSTRKLTHTWHGINYGSEIKILIENYRNTLARNVDLLYAVFFSIRAWEFGHVDLDYKRLPRIGIMIHYSSNSAK